MDYTIGLELISQKIQFCLSHLEKESYHKPKSILEELAQLPAVEKSDIDNDSIFLTNSPITLQTGENWDIFDFTPIAIARQMTIYDSLMLKRIPNHELHGQGWIKEKAPNISALINRFNKISNWTSTMVVMGTTAEIRALALSHLVQVASACLEIHNFHAVLAIVTGLCSTPVSRLHKSWNIIDSDILKCFEKLKELISINSKFKGLREAQEAAEGPCVPYLGVYLNDITFIEDANATQLNDKINFEKIQMLSNVILKLKKLINCTNYSFRHVETIQEYLNHPPLLSDDEIFDESIKREGRGNTDTPIIIGKTKTKRKKNVLGFILPEN